MQLKVLYVDDERDLLDLFVEDFANEQVQVFTYSDPIAALAAIADEAPDLIFLDYQLPGTTGDEVAKKIGIAIPKFLISGNLSVKPESVFERVLQKPINFGEVETLIAKHLEKKLKRS